MPNFIKSFRHVKKYTSCFKRRVAIKRFENFVGNNNKLVDTGVTWPKTRLFFTKDYCCGDICTDLPKSVSLNIFVNIGSNDIGL